MEREVKTRDLISQHVSEEYRTHSQVEQGTFEKDLTIL